MQKGVKFIRIEEITHFNGEFMKFLLIILSVILASCASQKDIEKTPTQKKAMIYYSEGTQQLINQEYTKALKNLLEANKLLPNDSKITNNLGMAFFFKGNKQRAVSYIKKSIELDKTNTDARINLATIHMNMGELGLAEVQYKEILKDLIYEGQFKTYYNLGILNLKRGQKHQAINYFKQSINTFENYCPSHFELGKIAMDSGSYEKALQYFKDAGMGVCYNNPEPIYMQSLALIKLGQYSKAQDKLEAILGRFEKSKYAVMARKKLSLIREMAQSKSQDNIKASFKIENDLVTPDF